MMFKFIQKLYNNRWRWNKFYLEYASASSSGGEEVFVGTHANMIQYNNTEKFEIHIFVWDLALLHRTAAAAGGWASRARN